MKKMKNIAVICLAAIMLVGMTFTATDFRYVVQAETVDNSGTVQPGMDQNDEGSVDDQDIPDEEGQKIYVDEKPYTGIYLDTDGVMYNVMEGVKGSALSGITAKGTSYYDSVAGEYKEIAAESMYVGGKKLNNGYYINSDGYMYKVSEETAAAVQGIVLKGTAYYSKDGAALVLQNDTVYVSGKTYSGYYMGSDGCMYTVSNGIPTPSRGTIAKGNTYYNNGRTVTVTKNTVYVNGRLYNGRYYMSSGGYMYTVSKGTPTLTRGTIAKGETYYSYNAAATLTLSKNTVYVGGKLYSGYYMSSTGKMFKVSKGTPTPARGTLAKGKTYYKYKTAKNVKVSKNTVYVGGKLYSGYYMSSTGKMYKVSKGTPKALSATLKKGTKYYSYNSAKTLKLTKKTVYVKGSHANVWAKVNGTWCYYNASGKQAFKSNTLYNAWKKINSKSSKTKYFMVVDTNNTKTMIFKGSKGNWVPVKLWSCSPGKASTPTVKGTFTVKAKGYSFGSGYTCYYYTQFYGDYLFHSILYNQGTFKVQDGRLGQKLSHGCVRLSLSNAKWIYKNIPRNTKVYIY